jgi:hypothetical protein
MISFSARRRVCSVARLRIACRSSGVSSSGSIVVFFFIFVLSEERKKCPSVVPDLQE